MSWSDLAAQSIMINSLVTGERRVLLEDGGDPRYVPTGHLAYVRDGTLLAAPFDVQQLAITGSSVPLVEGVAQESNMVAHFAFAADGTLVYQRGGNTRQRTLVWVDRDGQEELLGMSPRDYNAPALSPDGDHLVVSIGGRQEGVLYHWDVERQVEEQISASGPIRRPVWSPTGSQIAFASERDGQWDVYTMAIDGTGAPSRLTDSPALPRSVAWLSDGDTLLLAEAEPGSEPDIVTLRIGAGGPTEKLLQTDVRELNPVVSPNGRWMAYQSGNVPLSEVYVRPFPDVTSGQARLIGPGTEPLWGPNGQELFYRLPGDGVMVVDVETEGAFERGTPRRLFPDTYFRNWDLAPDGRFLMIAQSGATTDSREIILVQNWFEELNRLVPTN